MPLPQYFPPLRLLLDQFQLQQYRPCSALFLLLLLLLLRLLLRSHRCASLLFSLECVSTFAFFPAIFLCEPYDEDAPKSVGVVEYVGGQNNANGGSGAALSKSQKKKLKQKQSKQRKKGEDQVADGEEA